MRRVTSLFNIFFVYSSLIWTSFSATYSPMNYSDFLQLILHVHNYFSTSCVFIIHTTQTELNESDKIGDALHQLSRQGVLATAVEFIRLNETMRLYRKRVVRALVVIVLRTQENIAQFASMTSKFDMAMPCWLLLINGQAFLNYFTSQRTDNMFHLTFDTEFLVARTNHTIIQEWYWLRDKVKTEDLAEWDWGSNFTLKTNKSLYQRRTDLENSRIVVTLLHNPPMISFINNTIGGFFGKVLMELSTQANFETEFVTPKEFSYGSWNADENRWTGMMEMITNGKAHIAAADFTITSMRLDFVDFSLPLISTRDKLYIRQPSGGIYWSAYWQAFAPELWIFIELLIIFATVHLTLMTAIRGRKVTFDAISGYFLLVLGIYCQQGLPEFPIDLPSRITYFSIFLSAIIVSAGYSAALISYLTVTSTALPFSTLEGFVNDETYKLIVFRDGADYDMFSVATEPTIAKMWSKMKVRALLPLTLMDGFQQVCEEKVAFYIPEALMETANIHLPCKIVGIDTKRSMSLALVLSKGNPYNGLINYHVQKFRDHGILNRLKGPYAISDDPLTITGHSEVTLWGIVPVIAILVVGVLFAVIIFYLEKTYSRKFQDRYNRRGIRRNKNGVGGEEEIFKICLRDRVIRHFTPATSEFRN